MATYQLPLTQTLNVGANSILPADTTVAKTLITAGALGTQVRAVFANSNDTSDRILELILNDGTTDRVLCAQTIVLGSGTDGTKPCVDLLASDKIVGLKIDANGKRYLALKTGHVLKTRSTTTVTAAKQINTFADGEDY